MPRIPGLGSPEGLLSCRGGRWEPGRPFRKTELLGEGGRACATSSDPCTLTPPREQWALSQQTIKIPEPSLPGATPVEMSASERPFPQPLGSRACQGSAAWLAALCWPGAGEQVNASLQVLAKVRRAPAHGAVLPFIL